MGPVTLAVKIPIMDNNVIQGAASTVSIDFVKETGGVH